MVGRLVVVVKEEGRRKRGEQLCNTSKQPVDFQFLQQYSQTQGSNLQT